MGADEEVIKLFDDWHKAAVSLYWERGGDTTLLELLRWSKERARVLGIPWEYEADLREQEEQEDYFS